MASPAGGGTTEHAHLENGDGLEDLEAPLIAKLNRLAALTTSSDSDKRVGLLSSAAAGLFFALAAILVKVSSSGFSVLAVLWTRGVAQTIIVGAIFAYRRQSPWGPRELRGWLTLRGTLGVFAIVGYMIGIVALPVADAISLYSVKPVLAALLAALFLREPLRCIHGFASVLSVAGCVLVAQGKDSGGSGSGEQPDQATHVGAAVLVFVAAVLAAGTSIVTRRIMSRTSVPAEMPVWYFCIMDIVVLAVASPALTNSKYAVQPAPWTWGQAIALMGVPLFSVLGQQTMTFGLRHAESALSTVMVQTETVHVFIFQWLIYGKVSQWSVAGAFLICVATGALARFEMKHAPPPAVRGSCSNGTVAYTVTTASVPRATKLPTSEAETDTNN